MLDYVGLDYNEVSCWGLVQRVYWDEFKIELPDLSAEVDPRDRQDWRRVAPGAEQYGDVAVFREPAGKHVGVVICRGRMCHSTQTKGVTIERYSGIVWRSKLIGIYRHTALV